MSLTAMDVTAPVLSQANRPLDGVELLVPMHVLPGRIRFQLRGLRFQERAAERLERTLSAQTGIRRVQASALTGTLLVEFAPPRTSAEIAALVEDAIAGRLLPPAPASPDPRGSRNGNGFRARVPTLHSARDGQRREPWAPDRPILPAQAWSAPSAVAPAAAAAQPWHALAPMKAAELLGVSREGLRASEAQERLARTGLNVLPAPKPKSVLILLWKQLRSVPVLLLIGSAALSALTGGAIDGAVIGLVVILNTAIGFTTERHAERTIATLTRLEEPETLVMREGRVLPIDAARLTVGDVIPLVRGAYIPADARILEARNLTIAESALTGESAPVRKSADPLPSATPLAERRNMVYRGTVVTGGSGVAVVTATGAHTEIGHVHALINQASRPETPMERKLDQLGRQTAFAAIGVCAVSLLLGYLRGFDLLEMVRSAISLAVAALPEGLPSMSTTALAFGMLRMRRQNVLARSLGAVETLGAVNLLCLDKTGTLTMNRMAAVEVYAGRQQYLVGPRRPLLGAGSDPAATPHLQMLLAVCALCSEAEVTTNAGTPEFLGSATEVALLELVQASHLDVAEMRRRFPLLEMHARAEGRNYMATIHSTPQGRRLVAMKGSPEEVLRQCDRRADELGIHRLTSADRKRVLGENHRLASEARRVLGAAYLEFAPGEEAPREFIWLGLVALADPPRAGAEEAMRAFHRAGIDIRMVTGDQGATASAIGREIGLLRTAEQVQVWDASSSEDGSPRDLHIDRSRIFSRVTPSHKLEIVQALQRFGKIVAMTGDGINDGPALKAADVGIALGDQSTDTARESADLILPTDDLRCLVNAVREGRAVHHNIRQAVRFLIATNMSEVLSVLSAVALGLGQPLTSRQLLWLNLVTDIFPVLALAVEPPRPGVLETPPPDPDQPLIARGEFPRLAGESALIAGAVGGAYLYALRRYGFGDQATTMAFLSLTTAQILHTLAAGSSKRSAGAMASFDNKYVPLAVAGSLGLELLTVFTPIRSLLGLAPLNLMDFAVCVSSVSLSSLATYLLRLLWPAHRAPLLLTAGAA